MNVINNWMMQQLKEYLEEILRLIMKRFDTIDKKLDRLARIKDVMEEDELLDNQDVCMLLGITHRTLQRYKQHKLLPYQKIKGKSYYRKSDVLIALKRIKE